LSARPTRWVQEEPYKTLFEAAHLRATLAEDRVEELQRLLAEASATIAQLTDHAMVLRRDALAGLDLVIGLGRRYLVRS